MRFQCTFCSYIIAVEDDLKGYGMTCPSCSQRVIAPLTQVEEGCVIGDFVIERKLGEGSIGAVYEARQISLGRQVALKILFQEYANSKGIANFLKEARSAAKLNHPNLVRAFAVGEEDGTCFMAMSFIGGGTVKDKIRSTGRIPVDEALHITQQVAEALHYAWTEAKIIHRDIKPDNIMLDDDGLVKLTDLGLAMHQKDWSEDMDISGSPSYMSPEQFAGEKLDPRSDIYSLGITLYQMLSGELPFDAETVGSVARQHFHQEPVSLLKIMPRLSPKVWRLVKKMIAKEPEDRFADIESLLKALWSVRQTTAPDKELVPDIHTISIKRLDYSLQEKSVKEHGYERAKSHEVKTHKTRTYGVMAAGFILLMASLATFMLWRKQEESLARRSIKSVDDLIRQVEAAKRGSAALLAAIDEKYEAMIKLPPPWNELAAAKLDFAAAKLKAARLESEVSKLVLDDESRENSAKRAAAEITALRGDIERAEIALDKLRREHAAVKSELEEARAGEKACVKKLEAEVSRWAEKAAALEKTLDARMKNDLLAKSYVLVWQGRFAKPVAILSVGADRADDKAWFRRHIKQIQTMERLRGIITDSGVRCSGLEVGDGLKIVTINNGLIKLKASDGSISSFSWEELPPTDLLAVAVKGGAENTRETVGLLHLLQRQLSAAANYLPAAAVEDVRQAMEEYYLDKIDSCRRFDRAKAVSMAKTLLQLNAGHASLPEVKRKIEDLLSAPTAD